MRNRIILFSFLISILVHAVIGWNAIHTLRKADKEMSNQNDQEMMNQTSLNIVNYYQDLESLASLLRSEQITNFSRLYLNMQADAVESQEGNKVNAFLDRLSLQNNWVDKIYILGKNNNQANFSKTIGESGWSTDELPSIDELEEYGLMDVLLRGDGIPAYHTRQELLHVLSHAQKSELEIPQLVKNVHLVNEIEDRMTIAVYDHDVIVLIVLPQNFMPSLTNDALTKSHVKLRLYNPDESVIWTSDSSSQSTPGTMVQSKLLLPYQHRLELYHDEANGADSWRNALEIASLLVISLFSSVLIAYFLSGYIFLPLRQVSQAIKNGNGKIFPFRPIRFKNPNRMLGKMSLQRKLFYYFVCTVMLPTVCMGLLVSYSTFQMHKQQLISFKELITEQLGVNVALNKQSLTNLSYQLMLQETDLRSYAVSLHPKMNDISYYIRYDSKGTTQFSSIYGNNPELFPIDPSILTNAFEQSEWISLSQDVFSQSTSSFINKMMENGQTKGYIELRIKPSGLVTESSLSRSVLLLLNENNQALFQSYPGDLMFRSSAAIGNLQQVDQLLHMEGEDYIRFAKPVADTGWTLLQFVSLKEIGNDSKMILIKHIYVPVSILILAFILSYALSRRLVKPLALLHQHMSLVGEGSFVLYEREQKDEIKELADNFNRMISEINHLMEDQINSKIREQELSSLRVKAELAMLQQQINPHFLYNTLESVKYRAKQNDVEGINNIIMSLAEMLRYAVRGGSQEVPLAEELKQINHYYTIQKIRMRDKLHMEWDIEEQALNVRVLKFILQPLVENAIEHGILQVHTGGRIAISASQDEQALVIEVKDNGVGMDEEELQELRASLEWDEQNSNRDGGVGLKNVYQRLQLFYQGEASMQIESAIMKGTLIRLRIPR
ncbi:sensor histidine kinase [Paenibacillus sp. HB172176]|uniref:sensor histidine kinase n=1 Tax=Paenibacillus sp. HB172176 TaxID=2493690 RepID=UPI001438E5AE|nr:sensor histidine kinase [Paenibacillus sp. HB172176]